MEQQPEINLLQDIEQDVYLVRVSAGLRFANFLIDTIAFYAVVLLIGAFMGLAFVDTDNQIENSFLVREDAGSILLQYLFSFILYAAFFTVMEGSTKGRTLGKLITGTRAFRIDGSHITWRDSLLRSLCRTVPFEIFSALGGFPWHDKWTDTIVVKSKKY